MQDLQEIENRIMAIAKKRNLSKNKLLQNSNLSKSLFDNMKKGQMPSFDKLCAIAEYLDCSMDYIVGRTDIPQAHIKASGLNSNLVALLTQLTPEQQEQVAVRIEEILSKKNNPPNMI